MHACLSLPDGALLMAGDTPPGLTHKAVEGVMMALQLDDAEQARQAFAALAEGGQVTMPLAPTFWARVFGMVTDRFGVSWGISGEPTPMA